MCISNIVEGLLPVLHVRQITFGHRRHDTLAGSRARPCDSIIIACVLKSNINSGNVMLTGTVGESVKQSGRLGESISSEMN